VFSDFSDRTESGEENICFYNWFCSLRNQVVHWHLTSFLKISPDLTLSLHQLDCATP